MPSALKFSESLRSATIGRINTRALLLLLAVVSSPSMTPTAWISNVGGSSSSVAAATATATSADEVLQSRDNGEEALPEQPAGGVSRVLQADDDMPYFAWDSSVELDSNALMEGCTNPATMTAANAKNGKPKRGRTADLAVDGDASTRWASRGTQKWIEVEFDGGEGRDTLVEGVALAFYRGHRRVAFFDVSENSGKSKNVAPTIIRHDFTRTHTIPPTTPDIPTSTSRNEAMV